MIVTAQLLLSAKRKKQSQYRSVISDIFDGSILSLVQCLTCDRVRRASTIAGSMIVVYFPHNTRGSNEIIFDVECGQYYSGVLDHLYSFAYYAFGFKQAYE